MNRFQLNIGSKIFAVNGVLLSLFFLSILFIISKVNYSTDLISIQSGLVKKQAGLVNEQQDIMDYQKAELTRLEIVNDAYRTFIDMGYWLTDLAVSFQNESEENAELAKEKLWKYFDQLEKSDRQFVSAIKLQTQSYYDVLLKSVDAYVDENRILGNSLVAESRIKASLITDEFNKLLKTVGTESRGAVERVQVNSEQVRDAGNKVELSGSNVIIGNIWIRKSSITILIIISVFGITASLIFIRSLTRPIHNTIKVAEAVAKGDLHQQVAIQSNDEIGRMGFAFNKAIEAIRLANAESEAANTKSENLSARAISVFNGLASPMIQTDKKLVITYINPAAKILFRKYSSEFSKVYPEFDAENLDGTAVDIFLVNGDDHRKMLINTSKLPYNTDMNLGNYIIEINASPMIDANDNHLGLSIELNDVTKEREGAQKAAMLMSLVEAEEANVVTADKNNIVTYLNPAFKILLKNYETEFCKQFPDFDADKLIGRTLDSFHKDSNHPDGIISNRRSFPFKTQINIAGLKFALNTMALLDDNGNRIGFAVEWIDNNARVRYRDEVAKLINSCNEGDLKKRGDVEKMDDIYRPMLQGINDIIEAITEPIKEIQVKLEGVAKGDLTSYVTGEYKGDHQVLKMSLNNTLDSLNTILQQVNSSASQMASGSSQVSDSSQAISQGATQQAASLEEITSSMTEMGSQVKQNAENANQANQLVGAARGSADDGNHLMRDMVGAMSEIEDSSQSIQKIIKVIDEIAFQTNLLALNAAVEAARAGVHGKGFAVVAEEVRNLAARSASAAKETTELIEGSIKKVTNGTDLANSTATALNDIVDGVSKVTDLVGEIAAASSEQSQGISQVNEGLIQLDKVTQQNTASAEESASTSVELSGQAAQLQELLTQFTLNQVGGVSIEERSPALTSEMLEAIKQLTASQKTQNSGRLVEEDLDPLLTTASNCLIQSQNCINPDDIIPMDDKDMGRY